MINGRLNINIDKYFTSQQKTLKQKGGGWHVFLFTASYLFGDIGLTLQLYSPGLSNLLQPTFSNLFQQIQFLGYLDDLYTPEI